MAQPTFTPPPTDRPIWSLADVVAGSTAAVALGLWAAATLAHEIVFAAGMGLDALSLLTLVFWAAALLAAFLGARRAGGVTLVGRRGAGWLALLMLLGIGLAVISFRPDLDDSYYVPNVVHALAHPEAAITAEVRALAADPLAPFVSPHWAMSTAYDYLGGALARVTGLPLLDLRYLWLAGLAGAALVAGSFLLLRQLTRTEADALWATLLAITLLVIWRESHRDPGNFAFVRIFQGKAVAMTVVLPIFAAALIASLRTAAGPGRALGAGAVLACALAGAGMSASSVFLIGGVGVGVTAGCLAAEPRAARAILGRACLAAFCCLPLAVPLVRALADTLPLAGPESPANEGWPLTFAGHVIFMGKSTWALLLASLAVLVPFGWKSAAIRQDDLRLVLGWTLAVLVCFANPLTGQILIDHALGPNAYWRIFYTLPWLPLAGLAGLVVTGALPGALRRWRGPILAGVFCLAAGGMTAIDASNGRAPGWPPGWKLPADRVAEAREVIAAAPPGPMLAPHAISRYIPSLGADHPQLRMRTSGLRVWTLAAGLPELADRRILAATLLGPNDRPGQDSRNGAYLERGDRDAGPEAQARALAEVLAESRPASVVLLDGGPGAARAADILAGAGYARVGTAGPYGIWAP